MVDPEEAAELQAKAKAAKSAKGAAGVRMDDSLECSDPASCCQWVSGRLLQNALRSVNRRS